MYNNGDLCPVCGDGFLKEEKIQETFEYKDNYITIDDYLIYKCSDCKDSFVDPKTSKESEKVIRDFHRKIDGILFASADYKKIPVYFGCAVF